MARWGLLVGSVVTGLLFAAIHLPLAFDGASTAGDVALGIEILLGTGTGIGLRLLIDPAYDWIRLGMTVVLGIIVIAIPRTMHRAASEG